MSSVEGQEVNCTGCEYLDRRNGECTELIYMATCGACLKTYPIAEIRCSCGLVSTEGAGSLQLTDGGYQASAYCPLTTPQKAALERKQNEPVEPVLTQKELF